MKSTLLTIFVAVSLYLPLQAEIQNVTITYQAALCIDQCPALLEKEFLKIPGVQKVQVLGQAGQVELRWKPDSPFSLSPINTAMRMVGPRLKMVYVTVKGQIRSYGDTITLVSDGDGTTFNLVNRISPNPNQYFEQYNIDTRAIPPALRDELLTYERNRNAVVIQGPLFQPERIIPLQLVVQYLQQAQQPAQQQQKQRRF